MTQKELHTLIEKYSNETASEQEVKLLDSILSSAENDLIKSGLKDFDKIKTKQRIFKKIKKNTEKSRFSYIYRIAAAVIILIGISSFFVFQNSSIESSNIVFNDTIKPKTIYLPDSSKVILNSNSKLVYSENFNESIREVFLDGEAYFDVYKNKSKPFIVQTDELSTKVLGTEFNIKEGNEDITVTVTEGLVSVSNKVNSLNILPNQQIIFDSNSNKLVKKEVASSHFNLWYQENINLNNLTLSELAEILENLYDISVEFVNEEDKSEKMSISFNRNESIDQILERINFVNKVKFKKKDNEIIVK